MHVSLLGPVSAESAGTDLGLGGLKQRAVFALLALNAGRVVSLDRLVDELWPEEPPSRATLGLQSYVSRLRRVLAAASDADPQVPALVTRPPGWVLDLNPERVDVTRFERLVARARQLPGDDAGPLLREALGLWRGEPLADLQAVPFAREEAARLTELRLTAEESLLEAGLASGDAEVVVAEGGRFVAANPFRERGRRALALGLYRTGRQSEALAALTRLRRLLADELGLDPSPETRELEAGILRHDAALGLPPPDAPVVAVRPPPDRRHGELLGRETALAAVDGAVAVARSGRGSLLVLEAPAGAGKTTLLRAVTERTVAAGGSAVHGSGVGAGAVPALWPWVTVVRQVATLLPPDVAPPSPAAAHALDVLAAGGDGAGGSRTRLYRGVVDLLLAAAERPLAVVLDDAQWMDADSLDLLTLAVDELVEHAVVVAVAVRTGEPGSRDVTTRLHRARRDAVVRVPLPGLGVDDVGEIVRRVAGRPADGEVAETIHRRTLGNPFFVGEVVRLLASEQRLDPESVHEALPAEVEEVLRRRLDRLPQQTRALLAVVALAGGPVDVDTLATVTGVDPDTVLDACESALLAELLVEDGQAFVLRHDLVRQTLERGLSHARRARLHARLAEVLQARPALGSQDVVAVARHLTLAEPVVGPGAAIPFLVTGADDALSRNAHREAERLLEQALDLADRAPDRTERETLTATVRGRLAIARRWGGQTPAEETATGDEFAVPAVAESPTAWANALINRGLTGHYDEVATTAEETLLGELQPASRAHAHFVAGWAQLVRGRLEDADRHFRAFEELHDTTADVRPLGVAAAGYAAVEAHCQGDDARADRADRLAHARAARHEESTRMEAELYTARLTALRGDVRACREAAGRCAAIAERIESPVYAVHAQVLAAWADALLGDRSGAERADAAYVRVAATGVLLFVPFFLLLRAEAHAISGRPERAAELVAEAAARSAELGDVPRAPRLLALADELAGGRVQTSRKA